MVSVCERSVCSVCLRGILMMNHCCLCVCVCVCYVPTIHPFVPSLAERSVLD